MKQEMTITELKNYISDELSLEMVFTPVYLQMVAFRYAMIALDGFAMNRVEQIKKDTRNLKNLINDQMKRYRNSVPFDVYNSIKDVADELHDIMQKDLIIYYFTYDQAFKNQFDKASDLSSYMAYMAIAKDIILEIERFDIDMEKKVNEILKRHKIEYQRPQLAINDAFLSEYNNICKILGYKGDIVNMNIENARKILAKQARKINYA